MNHYLATLIIGPSNLPSQLNSTLSLPVHNRRVLGSAYGTLSKKKLGDDAIGAAIALTIARTPS